VQTAGVCLNIVGHTSRTGTEAVNDRISVARAETVKRLLEAQVRTLAPRLRATGVGFRENLVGSGTDDALDAVDRRVEFKVVDCPSR
jgi:outer membrane protein OmpA-like peptidoglycan-associated protein